jgi:hypothetical protein
LRETGYAPERIVAVFAGRTSDFKATSPQSGRSLQSRP